MFYCANIISSFIMKEFHHDMTEWPPRKKDNLSAVGGPSLPSAPILPEESESAAAIIPKVRKKQSVSAIPQSSQGNFHMHRSVKDRLRDRAL